MSLSEEVAKLGCRRALILTTPHQRHDGEILAERLGQDCAGLFSNATMHTPVDVSEAAVTFAKEVRADCLVALGGGSTTGLGKAIALRTDLPQVVIPTTYAGSEMTPILGQTSDGVKTTQKSAKILPEVVIYDVNLTLGLPVRLSGTSGINAIAHAVEALYAQERNPIVSLMAQESIAALARALPSIMRSPQDLEARSDALYGAFLAGSCLGAVGMALHHKLCHTIGGLFDLSHAETHTIILPHALAYNARAVPEALSAISQAFGGADPVQSLFDLAGKVGAPTALRDIGMPESGIEKATELAMANPYWNPRPLERSAIHELIARAWAGDRPKN